MGKSITRACDSTRLLNIALDVNLCGFPVLSFFIWYLKLNIIINIVSFRSGHSMLLTYSLPY